MSTLLDIERRAKALADERDVLVAVVNELNSGIETLKRESMRPLKAAVKAVAEQHDKLKALIEANPELFVRPRSVVLHGIKLGFRKGSGGVEFEDAERVAGLIQKHFPEQFDVLVQTSHKPLKTALAQLTVAEQIGRAHV